MVLPVFSSGQDTILNYTKENGLTSNEITKTLVDSKGIVWIGTNRGLDVFKGNGWSSISAIEDQATGKSDPLERVVALYEDNSGYLWVSAEKGLYCYTGEYWINFITKGEENYLSKNFYQDRLGRLWALQEYIQDLTDELGIILLSGTVQLFDGGEWFQLNEFVSGTSWVRYMTADTHYFNGILEDSKGNIWLSSLDGLFCLRGNKWFEYTEAEIVSRKTYDLLEDSRGSIWVGTAAGVSEFSGGQWKNYNKKDGLETEVIQKLRMDPEGRIWAYNPNDQSKAGVCVFEDGTWNSFSQKEMHIKGTVLDILFDQKEVVAWTNRGIALYRNESWSAQERNMGLKDKKYSLISKDDKGRIWLAGDRRLYIKNADQWDIVFQSDDNDLNVIKLFHDHSDHCWIATARDGIYRQTTDSEWQHYTVTTGLVSDNIADLFEDHQHNIWVVTNRGVSMIVKK